uniref:Uncharacterized protein n=1 Tax=Cacopsylla melanoneura TaxID=428564 RepID=A0A8D9E9U7_9HEMI
MLYSSPVANYVKVWTWQKKLKNYTPSEISKMKIKQTKSNELKNTYKSTEFTARARLIIININCSNYDTPQTEYRVLLSLPQGLSKVITTRLKQNVNIKPNFRPKILSHYKDWDIKKVAVAPSYFLIEFFNF